MPPNTPESSWWPGASTFTHSTPLASKAGYTDAVRFRQISSVGGSSVTLHTADAVKPARPAGPSVVMMLTAAPRRDMALR